MSLAKRLSVIICSLLIAAIGWYFYFKIRIPTGVTPQSDGSETVAWIALATGIIGLLTAIVGLIQRLIEVSKK